VEEELELMLKKHHFFRVSGLLDLEVFIKIVFKPRNYETVVIEG
jgi:hypothetical protein